MQETLISHPRLRVIRRTGSEGPHHDPYAYEEYEVKTPQGCTVLHTGLAVWLKFNGAKFPANAFVSYEDYEQACCETLFKRYTGYTRYQLERIVRKLKSRCRKCGKSGSHHELGYPGEHFEVCNHCGDIVGGYFCEDEIM